jgi:hypothetical protein
MFQWNACGHSPAMNTMALDRFATVSVSLKHMTRRSTQKSAQRSLMQVKVM